MRAFWFFTVFIVAAILIHLTACEPPPSETTLPEKFGGEVYESAGLANLIQVSDRIYSGSEPSEEQAFQALNDLGIKTVISVDGATPNLDLAKRYGLRYIHIPIGYDRVPADAQAQIDKALKEVEGPFYFHCHHGRHRGPAAAAVALRLDEDCEAERGLAILQAAGTAKKYRGLWRDVEHVDKKYLPESVQLYETAPVGSFASEMAVIDRIWDRLKLCQENNWQTPPDHPDVQPSHEAKMLHERFTQVVADPGMLPSDDGQLHDWLKGSRDAAKILHEALLSEAKQSAEQTFADLSNRCDQCHKQYRN